jgi:hypothetical protein
VIFPHFCEMFICMWLSVTLFRIFHVSRWYKRGSGLIDAYYFQLWAKGPMAYTAPINSGKWDH